jgi:Fe-S protein assembly co-chaperone HscB
MRAASAVRELMSSSSTLNYFELLGLPESVELDRSALERAYQSLQSQWHPDQFAGADATTRARAVQQTSLINDAYRTLREPVSRAAHLLALRGIEPDRLEQRELDPAFLFEQMEWREELEAKRGNEAALGQLGVKVDERFKTTWRVFAEALAKEALSEAKREFHKLQFLGRLQYEINEAEALLLDD